MVNDIHETCTLLKKDYKQNYIFQRPSFEFESSINVQKSNQLLLSRYFFKIKNLGKLQISTHIERISENSYCFWLKNRVINKFTFKNLSFLSQFLGNEEISSVL